MNILIPMAGEGSRFKTEGYTFPKPLIDVNGTPMIQKVVENLDFDATYIFLVRKEHLDTYSGLTQTLERITNNRCKIVVVDSLTEGAACTALLAEDLIDTDDDLLIANSDQFIEWNPREVMYQFVNADVDGGILTFESTHPKWSYAKCNEDGFVTEVAEKKVISKNATVGVYYWKHGSDYVSSAEEMIKKNIRVNNEFYVAPIYNLMVRDGLKITIEKNTRHDILGTPKDVKRNELEK